MNFNKIFADAEAVNTILSAIKQEADSSRNYRIMEVCGTHTMAIARFGIPSLLPANIELVSGPGCPVCVTSQADIDNCIDLAKLPNVTITTFGDMLRVVGSSGESLYDAKAAGADVRLVYSPLDTIAMAEAEQDRQFVFLAVGFETTTPMAAGLVKTVAAKGIKNISIYSMCKTMPAAFEALLQDDEAIIDGFLCPGNVSIITGVSIYEPIVAAGKAAVIAGFEPVDILSSVLEIVRQINSRSYRVENNYLRAVNPLGNQTALALTDAVFEPCDARWRGLGVLPKSGMKVRAEYGAHDAALLFNMDVNRAEPATACRCGDILKGRMTPAECPLFDTVCSPMSAIGPCMVSSEGACAAYYKYKR